MDNKKLKIASIGFDWKNIGINNPEITMSKLDRDGLVSDKNEFVLLYAGKTMSRKEIRKEPKFLIAHFTFFIHLRVLYDLFFVLYLPFVLFSEKYKPDIFYLTDFPFVLSAILPAKLGGSKIYFRLVNLPTELALTKGKLGKMISSYYKLMEKITIPFIDRFIVINETTRQYLLDRGINKDKIFTDIPDTIARDQKYIDLADKNYIRQKHNIGEDKKIILSVGSLIKEKGYDELINKFAELNRKDLILLICGEGKKMDSLKNLINNLNIGDRVIFAGKVERDKLWNYYAGADIFTLFTKSESLGMVFWEAMYMNIPVIGPQVSGVKESVGKDGERGFYWRGDIDDLERKIDVLLNKENSSRNEAIKKAKEYVKEKMKQKITINEIYNKS